jgi:SAM-dependent methyltransferase
MSAASARGFRAAAAGSVTPWQLEMFRHTLKKQQKVDLLRRLLGPVEQERCLLLTCGDNNGAMNYVFRASGGRWTWADVEGGSIPEMSALLGEPVHEVDPARLPFGDGDFDRVVVIDVHEHIADVHPLNRELARILAPGGLLVVTTPNGAAHLPVALLKRWIGMGPAQYGHVVQGYGSAELEAMVVRAGLRPESRGAYARFFTELIELALNFAYVKLLSRRRGGSGAAKQGPIAPTTSNELKSIARSYRLYAAVYPFTRAFAALDHLLPGRGGYAVAVSARKPA